MTTQQVWILVRTIVWGILFLLFQMWYLPQWMGLHGSWNAVEREPLRWLGLLPLLIGSIIVVHCVFHFGAEGRGTAAPFDPPRKLVIRGLYRRVRNPMYYGLALMLIGEAVLFGDLTRLMIYYAVGLITAVHMFVMVYEEPTLRHKFSEEYKEYCRHVPRWFGWSMKM